MKRGIIWAVLLSLVGVGGVWSAHAATFNSTNFSINGNLGDSAAGGQSSTNYQLVSAGGESIAGTSSSASYILGQGYVPTLEDSMQVVVQPNGLVAYWSMDAVTSGGPVYDETTNGNNGTFSTSSTLATGKVGNAWSDSSGAQYADVPHSASFPTSTVMTLSGWIYHSAAAEDGIMGKWNYSPSSGSWAWQTTTSGDQLRMYIKASGTDAGVNYVDSSGSAMSLNTWYHVAMVYDGSQANANRVKLFINGVQQSTTVTGTIPATLTTSTDPIRIGDFSGQSRYWSGRLDELKVYSRALNADEIKADYDTSNLGSPVTSLNINAVTPGTSQTALFDSIVQTSSPGYTLAISQNNNLSDGANTIPSVSGSIASPVAWSEGTTKGLGFTLYGTNATALPGTWASGSAYAALPASATSFYTRTGYTAGTKDIINARLRLDTTSAQVSGSYINQMTVTGTMTP